MNISPRAANEKYAKNERTRPENLLIYNVELQLGNRVYVGDTYKQNAVILEVRPHRDKTLT